MYATGLQNTRESPDAVISAFLGRSRNSIVELRLGEPMHTGNARNSVKSISLLLFLLLAFGGSLKAQTRMPSDSRSSYYYQAYDQGFRAGRADYDAGRTPSYHAALVTTAGVAAISQDYRNAFKLGYQDGYAGHSHGSDWYYQHHHHDADCDEDDEQGSEKWSCHEHHDNGKHKGWYKHHRPKHGRGDEDDNEQD